jgi:hypothetical protein
VLRRRMVQVQQTVGEEETQQEGESSTCSC